MRIYIQLILPLIAFCVLFSSCDKYLDITPKGARLLTTVADYDLWLNDVYLVNSSGELYEVLNQMGDNVDMVNITVPATTDQEMMYTWADQFSTDMKSAPALWGDHYAKINHYNTLLLGIDQATGGTSIQRRSVKAEALLGRAFEYFYLINEYGQPYDPATAETDPGVPFVTSNDVSQRIPDRGTVEGVYQHIIKDLNEAIPDLPADNGANRFRGSKGAGYSLLSRIFFYRRNYAEAQKNAELALSFTNAKLLDYNQPIPKSTLSVQRDVIYGRMFMSSNAATLEYMRSFSTDDLRLSIFYSSEDDFTFSERGATQFFPLRVTPTFIYMNSGTSVQEMKLIIAECAARKNDLTVALQQLDELRKTRFEASTYVPFASGDQETVLQEILLERNHELGFQFLRWFDMRRLDKENRMGTVNRFDGKGNVIATLEPHSTKYTLQIPIQVLSFNPGMKQNP